MKKVLVAYGSRYGSARAVAGDIAVHLKGKGHEADVVDLRKQSAPSLPGEYDLVVAGSGIAMFSWVGKVKAFLRKCRKAGIPTVVFITCGTAIEDPEKAREKFLDKMLGRIGLEPAATLICPPVLDFRPGEGMDEALKNRIKTTVQAMAKDDFKSDGLMDFRDGEAFSGFLEELTGVLS